MEAFMQSLEVMVFGMFGIVLVMAAISGSIMLLNKIFK